MYLSLKRISFLTVVLCLLVGGFLFSPFVYAEPDRAGGDGVSGGRDGQVQEVYIPLEPLPGVEVREVATVEGFLGAAYRIGVSLAILLAVVMLMYGGIKYIVTSSSQGKGDARDTIEKALIGLLLAVGGYSLLFLIGGPGVMDVDLRFPAIEHREPIDATTCRVTLVHHPVGVGIEGPSCESIFGRVRGMGEGVVEIRATREVLETIRNKTQGGTTALFCIYDPGDGSNVVSPYRITADTACMQRLLSPPPPRREPGDLRQACLNAISRTPTEAEREYMCAHHSPRSSIVGGVFIQHAFLLETERVNPPSPCRDFTFDDVVNYARENCRRDLRGQLIEGTARGLSGMYMCARENPRCAEEPTTIFSSPFGGACHRMTWDFDVPGPGRDPTFDHHKGIDFARPGCGSHGEPVFPVYEGRVVFAGIDTRIPAKGYYVEVRHELPDGRAVETYYMHLISGSITVQAGDLVTTGTQLGQIGNTGEVYGRACPRHPGTHLHFAFARPGVATRDKYYDPVIFFDGDVQLMRSTLSGC